MMLHFSANTADPVFTAVLPFQTTTLRQRRIHWRVRHCHVHVRIRRAQGALAGGSEGKVNERMDGRTNDGIGERIGKNIFILLPTVIDRGVVVVVVAVAMYGLRVQTCVHAENSIKAFSDR
jgi:hypothetical protein